MDPQAFNDVDTGLLQGIGTVGLIIYFAIVILMIASMWAVFSKAGKPGWAAIVPIYNLIVMVEITGKPVWWALVIILIPVVNIIFLIWTWNLISLSFGKGTGFTIGLIFLPFIFWPILGFGSAKYEGPAGAPQVPQAPVAAA